MSKFYKRIKKPVEPKYIDFIYEGKTIHNMKHEYLKTDGFVVQAEEALLLLDYMNKTNTTEIDYFSSLHLFD